MNWKARLKEVGADGEKTTVALMEWFIENPTRKVGTTEMAELGIRIWKKLQREWSLPNGATLEKKARDLRGYGLLESEPDGKYILFKLASAYKLQTQPPRPILQVIPKRQMLIDGEWKWVERPDLIEI